MSTLRGACAEKQTKRTNIIFFFFFFLELKRKNCVICVEFLLLSVIYGGNVISVCDEMLFHLCIPIFGEQVFFLFLYFNFTSYTDSYCYL